MVGPYSRRNGQVLVATGANARGRMKVFISWSGERSKIVAEALRDWLPAVIQSVKPWVSSKDIDKGSRSFAEIQAQLKDAQFGIACLTPENLTEMWIHFESGAVAKAVGNDHPGSLASRVRGPSWLRDRRRVSRRGNQRFKGFTACAG